MGNIQIRIYLIYLIHNLLILISMTAKEQAIKDIKSELKNVNSHCFLSKSFIEYRPYLNPVMRSLVKQQLDEQRHLKPKRVKSNRQIVASCFFCDSGKLKVVRYYNSKPYEKNNRKHS